MLSEQQYREVIGKVCRNNISDNNDFILSLAMHGLLLLPCLGNKRPFDHYIQAPHPVAEIGKNGKVINAWPLDSWIVDCDWEEHVRPTAKFQFTPLRGKK